MQVGSGTGLLLPRVSACVKRNDPFFVRVLDSVYLLLLESCKSPHHSGGETNEDPKNRRDR